MEELIAKRYAKALSSIGNDMVEVAEILNVLTVAIDTAEVKTILHSPIVSHTKKTEMILATLPKDVNNTLTNFIKVLGENKRLDLIPSIAKVINSELQAASNKYEGLLKTKNTLDEKSIASLEKTLEKYTGSVITLRQEKSDVDDLRVSVNDLGIEVNFSKQRVKEQLIDFIKKSL